MNDKTKHYLVGLVLGLLTLPLSFYCGKINAAFFMLLVSSFVFIGKEITDKYDIELSFYKHKATGFDKMDLVADYLGLISGYIVAIFIKGLIEIVKL